MKQDTLIQTGMDIEREWKEKHYKTLTEFADKKQTELIHEWQTKESGVLEHLILAGRPMLNYWVDSIRKKDLWYALVRFGAWIGTLEAIERDIYEENNDRWLQKRLETKKIYSIKHFPEMIHLLEIKGIMTHTELAKGLGLNHVSTLTELIKKVIDTGLIHVRKSGKYTLYSLTDAGIRCGKQLRAGAEKADLLQKIIGEYQLDITDSELDSYLDELKNNPAKVSIKPGQELNVKIDDSNIKSAIVESIFNTIQGEAGEDITLVMKSTSKKDRISFLEREGA